MAAPPAAVGELALPTPELRAFGLRTLRSRRFRWLLLGVVATVFVPAFAWMILVYPLAANGGPSTDLNA